MARADTDAGSHLAIEALAGAAAAVAVALLARKAHARRLRLRLRAPGEREPDGSPGNPLGRLAEFLLLRVAFRSVLLGVRFTGRRLLA